MTVTIGTPPSPIRGKATTQDGTALDYTPYTVVNVDTDEEATIYSDPILSTSIASPTTDTNGVYEFYIASGLYRLEFTTSERVNQPEEIRVYTSAGVSSVNGLTGAVDLSASFRRTGAIAETFERGGRAGANLAILVSGRLHLRAINLRMGQVVSSITYLSGTTAAVTPTNQWFVLHDSSRVLLRQTVNDTTAAWGSVTEKTLALTSSFTVTYTGLHYVGIMVEAATVPTLVGNSSHATLLSLAPALNGSSTTGLTTTAPNPAAALAGLSSEPYAWLS